MGVNRVPEKSVISGPSGVGPAQADSNKFPEAPTVGSDSGATVCSILEYAGRGHTDTRPYGDQCPRIPGMRHDMTLGEVEAAIAGNPNISEGMSDALLGVVDSAPDALAAVLRDMFKNTA
jgi:hypothetical protein